MGLAVLSPQQRQLDRLNAATAAASTPNGGTNPHGPEHLGTNKTYGEQPKPFIMAGLFAQSPRSRPLGRWNHSRR